jgi:hypothetical protein
MGTRAVRETPSGVGKGVGVAEGAAVGGGGVAVGDGDGEGGWVGPSGARSVRTGGRARVASALALGVRVGNGVALGGCVGQPAGLDVVSKTRVGWTGAIRSSSEGDGGAGDVSPSWETAKRRSRIAKDQ